MVIDIRVRLPEEFRQVTREEMMEFYGKYNEIFSVYDAGMKSTEVLLKEMEEAEIELAVIHAEYEFGEDANKLNEKTASLVKEYPDKFAGFGTVNLDNLKPLSLVEQAESIHQLGLKGINLQPIFFDVDPLDRRLYPLYATAARLGLIVTFHTGVHYSMKSAITENNPLFIDQIAIDFPPLKIIACHGGWPWIPQMTAIARRHRNVFIEFGGLDPKYIALPGSGWETLFVLMNNLLQNQILFGTDWPVLDFERAKKGFLQLGLKEEVLEKLFYRNAKRLLKSKEGLINV